MISAVRDCFRERAYVLDAADPLAAYRERFHIPRAEGREVAYLCGNSLGLQPRGVEAALAEELEAWRDLAVAGHFRAPHPWYAYHEFLRDAAAGVVGALPGEVAMMNALTVNLHLMLVSFYRPQGRRCKILMEDPSFPSDRYALDSQIRYHGYAPEEALAVVRPRAGEATLRHEDLLAAIDGDVALVFLSGVNYLTGQLLDMEAIAARAREAGCVVGFDLAHAAGNVPLALHDWGVDFAVWCSYKYLNSGPGAVGGCFVHARHAFAPDLPRFAGWWGNDPATRFRMADRFVPQPGADGWQLSNAPVFNMAACRVSLGIFAEAGMARLRARSIALTGWLQEALDAIEHPPFEVITPRDAGARGCQLSLRFAEAEVARSTAAALEAAGVVCDFREPDILRAAPVPLYNSYVDAWRFANAVAEAAR